MVIQAFLESVRRPRHSSSTATASSRASLPMSCGTAIWRCGSKTWRRSAPTRPSSATSTSYVGAAPPPPSLRTRSGSETLACCSAASAPQSLRDIPCHGYATPGEPSLQDGSSPHELSRPEPLAHLLLVVGHLVRREKAGIVLRRIANFNRCLER